VAVDYPCSHLNSVWVVALGRRKLPFSSRPGAAQDSIEHTCGFSNFPEQICEYALRACKMLP
jgi:hypothetical protein